jgi:aquaporin NIP
LLYTRYVLPELRLRFQCIESGVENPLERFGHWLELIVLPFALATSFNQAGPAQIGEMTGDTRLVGIESAVQETNADFAFAHEVEETKPIHIRESGEKHSGLIIHAVHIRLDEFDIKRQVVFALPNMTSLRQKVVAEFIGTFALVFAGTGAIVINDVSGGGITHMGIALTFGLVVLAMIYTVGDISGAHLNPAVTVGFWLSGRFAAVNILPFVASQVAGASAASGVLRVLFPTHPNLGSTLPAGSAGQSFVLELILTFLLMFVILNVSTGAKEKGITAGIAVGAVIALEAMFAGKICGASMNPARSLAPAVVSGTLNHLWIYLTAPFAGAALAIFACRGCQTPECCPLPARKNL